ncbi:MAG TPA: histidinol-phosphate transaminase [Gemmatimonadaceae bacterium]|nr:histidinol-phosphate transaminase [Gemmatimonadaceae bacterium]
MASLTRASLAQLSPYATPQVVDAVDLSDNTNLWGTPPRAAAALRELQDAAMTRYPSTQPAALLAALAAYAGVAPEMIVPGCGSDDLIDCAMRAFAEPGDTIAFAAPTFSMVAQFAHVNGLRIASVPLQPDFDIDVEALLASRPRIVYLCSPNNPTGTGLPRATIERVLREAPGVVLLDEAYGEFTDAPGFDLVHTCDRLVVTRTMSKAFGLAGLRIGYAVLAPGLARALTVVRGPYKLNAGAEAAAAAALTTDRQWVEDRATEAVVNRVRLVQELASLGLAPLPSEANFLCIPRADATSLAEGLAARGFLVRALSGLPPVNQALADAQGSALRITVGPWPVMEAFLAALRAEVG